jgi:serine/threonine protein kinase
MSNVYGVVSQESGRTGLLSFLFVNRNLLQNEAGQLKVSDFGLLGSHIRSITSSSSDINAYAYMAPELYRKEAFQKNVDVFSFGIILHEVYSFTPLILWNMF